MLEFRWETILTTLVGVTVSTRVISGRTVGTFIGNWIFPESVWTSFNTFSDGIGFEIEIEESWENTI